MQLHLAAHMRASSYERAGSAGEAHTLTLQGLQRPQLDVVVRHPHIPVAESNLLRQVRGGHVQAEAKLHGGLVLRARARQECETAGALRTNVWQACSAAGALRAVHSKHVRQQELCAQCTASMPSSRVLGTYACVAARCAAGDVSSREGRAESGPSDVAGHTTWGARHQKGNACMHVLGANHRMDTCPNPQPPPAFLSTCSKAQPPPAFLST